MALRNEDSPLVRRCVESFKRNALSPFEWWVNSEPADGAAAPLENAIQSAYRNSDADLFVVAADDLECVTYGWDRILLAYRDIYPGARVFFGDEGRKAGELVCHGIFSREWIDILGYAITPGYAHYYSDTTVERTARLANVLHYIPSYKTRHWVGASSDKQYIDSKLALMQSDRNAYLTNKTRQEQDAQKIIEAIRS